MTKPTDYRIEVIFSFDDLPQEFYNLDYNSQEQYVPGQITEAELMVDILGCLSAEERGQLCKVSICVQGDEPLKFAPWLLCKDSPLYNGKLWLKQHRYQSTPELALS